MSVAIRKLKDCTDVLPGYSLKARAEHGPEGTHQLIMAKHIPDGLTYNYGDHHEFLIVPKGPTEKYKVHSGDVLFISRGTRNRAVVVDHVPASAVASATLYILRVKQDIDPAYLAWALNQIPLQSQIMQIRTGAGTPIVQRKLLGDIEIPVPSLDKQHHLSEIGHLMLKEKSVLEELLELTILKHNLIGQQLLSQVNDN